MHISLLELILGKQAPALEYDIPNAFVMRDPEALVCLHVSQLTEYVVPDDEIWVITGLTAWNTIRAGSFNVIFQYQNNSANIYPTTDNGNSKGVPAELMEMHNYWILPQKATLIIDNLNWIAGDTTRVHLLFIRIKEIY